MQLTQNDSLFKSALLIWRAARTECSQSESARSLFTLYYAQVKKYDSVENISRRLKTTVTAKAEDNPAGGYASQQRQKASTWANSAGRGKRDLFTSNEDDDGASQQAMQGEALKKRLQQFTMDSNLGLMR